ncbi:hypothetical protein MN032_01115 [Agromyces atrinae]|uniref:hypothetical protein n=1 Tax=Agromyces atrinae TaxID=592376 RepID=UPI001F57626A|nr:hypothetical protein [Agromyces atrinae]MCI2956275.1 hypothetical protein [Agromyces atrinae]
MAWFRRRAASRPPRIPAFLRALKQPEIDPLESAAEGVMLAEYAGVMRLKNRIIVATLGAGGDFSPDAHREDAREVLRALAEESRRASDRLVAEREAAMMLHGRGTHQHDYRSGDATNLELREEIGRLVASRLEEKCSDDEALDELIERARAAAWADVAVEIESTLDREVAASRRDPDYEAERDERMRQVRMVDLLWLQVDRQRT